MSLAMRGYSDEEPTESYRTESNRTLLLLPSEGNRASTARRPIVALPTMSANTPSTRVREAARALAAPPLHHPRVTSRARKSMVHTSQRSSLHDAATSGSRWIIFLVTVL
jgi:hypothetical protein